MGELSDNLEAASQHVANAKVAPQEKMEFAESQETATLVSVHRDIRTPKDALDRAEIDTSIWEIERQVVNSWPCAMAGKDGSVKYIELWQVKLWLRRKAPRHVQEGIRQFLDELKKHAPVTPKPKVRKSDDGHLLEISPYDSHFGKYCWGAETGTDFDTEIAKTVYLNAIDDLLRRVSGYNIERIMVPIGHDFFQVNSWANTTQRGTPVDHDGRFARVFQIGKLAVLHAVNRCLEVAPVDLLYVPGNHDPETAYYLCDSLASYYHKNKHVTVDLSPKSRKVYTWGEVFLFLDHGQLKPAEYLSLAATEYPELWGASKWREAHVGHTHRKKEMRTVDVDEKHGFRFRIMPSLSGTDKWHYEKGFVSSRRCMEAYLWHRTEWYVGHFSVNVRE